MKNKILNDIEIIEINIDPYSLFLPMDHNCV